MQENDLIFNPCPYEPVPFFKFSLNIIFHDIGTLQPKDDITPKEAVQISMMLASASINANVDFLGFAKENGLERHFNRQSI